MAVRALTDWPTLVLGTVLVVVGCGLAFRIVSEPSVTQVEHGGFTGQIAHDFGVVDLSSSEVTLQHEFVLTNTLSHAVRIEAIRTTCGCTEAEVTPETVESGAPASIKSVLRLTASGVKTAQLIIRTDQGDEPIVLALQATGRRRQQLSIDRQHVEMSPEETATVRLLYLDYDTDDAPPAPGIDEQSDWQFTFGQWNCLQQRQAEDGLPARWQIKISITMRDPNGDSSANRERHRHTIRVGDVAEAVLTTRASNDS